MALGAPVAGAISIGASGNIAGISYPSGIVATDQVLLFVGYKPAVANTGSAPNNILTDYGGGGWTPRGTLAFAGGYGSTLGADTGNTSLYVYSWDVVVASPSGVVSLAVTGADVGWAFIVRVPTGGGQISYGNATGSQISAPSSSLSVTTTDQSPPTNFYAGDLAIWAMCIPTDVTTPNQFSAQTITATGATFATAIEFNEPDSSINNDIGGFSAYATVSSGTSSTAPTLTSTVAGTLTNVRGPVVVIRIRETNGNFFMMF